MINVEDARIAVVGLGYIGLPLAVEFGKKYPTIGYDFMEKRVRDLRVGRDATRELEPSALQSAKHLTYSHSSREIADCNVFIVAVPTPVDSSRQPDLAQLKAVSEMLGTVVKSGDVLIYESTVFPGATEEVCIPIVEQQSGLVCNRDFYAGYSPERVNPGDKNRPITSILKVTSGSTHKAAEFVDALYRSIIPAGTFLASSIKVAEAVKVIENTQRDVNIALMNELSIVFSHLGIDTTEVLEAAATKWNFIRLQPGLVGGHCIGVDPDYLIHKSAISGHRPDVIRISREINDGMARNAADRLVRTMAARGIATLGARALVLGFTFKENCPDIRNTKIVDFVAAMCDWGIEIDIHDAWANVAESHEEYGVKPLEELPDQATYDAVVLAVKHDEYVSSGSQGIKRLLRDGGVFFDMESAFARNKSDLRL